MPSAIISNFIKNLVSGDGPIHVVERTSLPVSTGRPAYAGGASKQSRRLPKEDADQIKTEESGHSSDPRTKERAKVAKWGVSKAAAARVSGKKLKRVRKSDDVLDGCRHDVDESTRRDPGDVDNE